MSSEQNHSPLDEPTSRMTEEYRVLHKVANILHTHGDLLEMLQNVMKALTDFEDLKVEKKAGIFLADHENQTLRLFTLLGDFNNDFVEMEQSVPFGDCLCGRVAVSGDLLMSSSCFDDSRHDRIYKDMTAHGHYIIPLKSDNILIGVMFLYTNTYPAWYQHSQEVMLSIGGLIGEAIRRKQIEQEMDQYRNHLETLVEIRTADIAKANKKLQKEIEDHKKTQALLRKLSNQIQGVREEEKSKISREVHDELGQSMTAIKMDLLNLQKNLSSKEKKAFQQVESMVGLVDKTLDSIQRISMELRPPILDAFGLGEAIAWQADEFQKRFGIRYEMDCKGNDDDLSPDLMIALFRVFQESLTNIARHSQAKKVKIALYRTPGLLSLKVEDDGIGFENNKLDDPTSLGLLGIQERVRFWNGRVSFKGEAGKGTRVHVQIPLNLKENLDSHD